MTAKKILILAANPKGTTRLRLDEEVSEIGKGLAQAQHRDQFELKPLWAVRPIDIQRAMLNETPQIVHFSGHGDEVEGLIFEDETGNPKFVDGEALAGLFSLFSDQLECVVLNGCYSESQANAIVRHIPYVIGMNRSIDDKAAIAFAVGFYDALGAGRSVEFAYKFGCAAIGMAGLSGKDIPVLIPSEAGKNAATSVTPISPIPPATSTMPSNPASASTKSETKSETKSGAIEVFFSYAHEDEKLRDELAKHLKLLERQGVIAAWYDRDISGGTEWKQSIMQQLDRAKIILLLISADFLASDFCWSVELKRAMERHEAGEARVIPIILRPIMLREEDWEMREGDWESTPFCKLQPLPHNKKPVTDWTNTDQAFTEIARGIRRVVDELKK